jgi:hypothetical protein
MSGESELLTSREPFFKNDVSLQYTPMFCGDERTALYDGSYLHVFGGVANPAYTSVVLARATRHSSSVNFTEAVAEAAAESNAASIAAGIHSDTHSETGQHIATEGDSPIGCGYIKLRQPISAVIAEDPNKVVAEAETLCPELFTDPSDTNFAHEIVRAHKSLATDENFFTGNSRQVAAAAINKGAPTMLVDGNHIAVEGIINKKTHSTIDSNAASKSGASVYVHDSWANQELAAALPELQPYTRQQLEIAELIDTIGTMWALGVKTIAIRR